MKKRIIFFILLIFITGLEPVNGLADEDAGNLGELTLDTLFIQLDFQMAEWTEDKWQNEFEKISKLGFKELIVQWCRQDDIKYYPGSGRKTEGKTDIPPGPERAMIPTIMGLSALFGMDIYLGLFHDSEYWTRIKAPPAVVENYLISLVEKNLEVAGDLLPLVARYRGFRGFYIPQEIDDVTWIEKEKAAQLKKFIQLQTNELRKLHGKCDILMSTFFRGRTSPAYFANLWHDFVSPGTLDGLLIQDGIGSGDVTYDALDRYLQQFHRAFQDSPIKLWGIVEAFEIMEAGEGKFTAKSAALERIIKQIQITGPVVDKLAAFSFRYFIPSPDIPGAETLYRDYRMYYENK